MKKQLLRLSTMCLLLMLAIVGKAETITATWSFTNKDVVTAVTALSGKSEAGTVESVEKNGVLLTVNANGQTIRDNGNSIQTGNGVVFQVPVVSTNDVVTVTGYAAPYFAYAIGGVDATEAITAHNATANEVAKGYVEIVNKGQYLIAIEVKQDTEGPKGEPTAEDVTGTWNFGNAGLQTALMEFSGKTEAGEVEDANSGLKMIVEANGATFRANGDNMQIRKGAVMKIPVKNAGDLITVNGYPGYSYYTIGNSTDELKDDNTYKAKPSDAEAGFVAVTSTNDNNYYKVISVVQYAPKPKVTLDNEAATISFPFNEGTEGQKATFSNADYFLSSKVTLGGNWTVKDKTTYADR